MSNSGRRACDLHAEQAAISRGARVRFGMLTLAHVAFVVAFVRLAPELARLFANFGVELPQFTRMVLQSRATVALFLVICAVAQIALFMSVLTFRSSLAWRLMRIVGLTNLSIAIAIFVAVYLVPMFLLGSPV
jgi:hypothetical protein